MMIINNNFEIKDTVYLKTDSDQMPRIVISLQVYDGGELLYELSCGTSKSYHYDFEISAEKDVSLVTNG